MWPNPQCPADLVTFTEEILYGKLHFLCSDSLSFKDSSPNSWYNFTFEVLLIAPDIMQRYIGQFQFYLTNWNFWVDHELHRRSRDEVWQIYIVSREERGNNKLIFLITQHFFICMIKDMKFKIKKQT